MKFEPMDRVLRQALAAQTGGGGGGCPDDNEVAAYLDHRLRPDERARLEEHASACAACREALALALELQGKAPDRHEAPAGGDRKILFHFQIPASVLALILVAAIAGILYYRKSPNAPATQIAARTEEAKTLPPSVPETNNPPVPSPQTAAVPMPRPVRPRAAISAGPGKEVEAYGRRPISTAAAEQTKAAEPPAGIAPEPVEPAALEERVAEAPQPKAAAASYTSGAKLGTTVSLDQSARMLKAGSPPAQDVQPGPSRYRFIGDRTFTLVSGVWVDSEAAKRQDAPTVRIKRDSGEYAEILKTYPGLSDLHPVRIYWKGRTVEIGDAPRK